jgi:hypothetical protein
MAPLQVLTIRMLEWREREHEDDDFIVGNDPGTVNALRQCGLLKFFKIQGMRAQLRLLEYLVHMWDVDQQVFHVGVHMLSLDIEDIYFLTGLSRRGSHVTLTGGRGGGLPMSEYVHRYCDPEAERRKGKVSIRGVRIYPYGLSFHYFTYGGECISSHGPPELFSVCSGVHGAPGI